MSLTVPARELENAFHAFLHERGITLNSVSAPTLLLALVDYFNEVRIQNCSREEGWDYLHFEASGNSFYFERILYAPDADPDDDERTKCGMTAGPELEVFPNSLEFPSTNLWSQNYPNAAAFAEAVLEHPALRWAETAGPLKSSTFFEEMC
ncbi:hypothetical protein [Deinococcus marmoris]|uniref:hypothetical protein n=1 Tax=Deinococcus marmoris TaxID=249408 RepID=UPI000AB23A6F|nr:hypothetical protein [Deinococcus marmoris]